MMSWKWKWFAITILCLFVCCGSIQEVDKDTESTKAAVHLLGKIKGLEHHIKLLEDERTAYQHSVDYSPLNFKTLNDRSNEFWSKDPLAPLMLGVMKELYTQRLGSWMTAPLDVYLRNNSILAETLHFVRHHNLHDIAESPMLLIVGAISKFDDVDLQEWLLWQLAIVGAHHIVLYLPDPHCDHSLAVIGPFIESGHVSVVDMINHDNFIFGDIYKHFIDTVKSKSCNFSGHGNIFESANCSQSSASAVDHFDDTFRPVWAAFLTTRDFIYDPIDGDELADMLRSLSSRYVVHHHQSSSASSTSTSTSPAKAALATLHVNAISLPVFQYGHNDHFLTPQHKLVTEAYTLRKGYQPSHSRTIHRVSSIASVRPYHNSTTHSTHSMQAEYADGSNDPVFVACTGVGDEHSDVIYAGFRANYYETKSVENMVKDWLVGGAFPEYNSYQRHITSDIDEFVDLVQSYANDKSWRVPDDSALSDAAEIRMLLNL